MPKLLLTPVKFFLLPTNVILNVKSLIVFLLVQTNLTHFYNVILVQTSITIYKTYFIEDK